eukprot:gene5202-5440_t
MESRERTDAERLALQPSSPTSTQEVDVEHGVSKVEPDAAQQAGSVRAPQLQPLQQQCSGSQAAASATSETETMPAGEIMRLQQELAEARQSLASYETTLQQLVSELGAQAPLPTLQQLQNSMGGRLGMLQRQPLAASSATLQDTGRTACSPAQGAASMPAAEGSVPAAQAGPGVAAVSWLQQDELIHPDVRPAAASVPGASWFSAVDLGAAPGAEQQRQDSLDISPLLSPLTGTPSSGMAGFNVGLGGLLSETGLQVAIGRPGRCSTPSSVDVMLSGTGSTPGGMATAGLAMQGLSSPPSSSSAAGVPHMMGQATMQLPTSCGGFVPSSPHSAVAGGLLPTPSFAAQSLLPSMSGSGSAVGSPASLAALAGQHAAIVGTMPGGLPSAGSSGGSSGGGGLLPPLPGGAGDQYSNQQLHALQLLLQQQVGTQSAGSAEGLLMLQYYQQLQQLAATDPDWRRIFVGNIGWWVDEEMLQRVFGEYGTILDAQVMWNTKLLAKGKRVNREFAFISYSTPEEAGNAIYWMHGKGARMELSSVNGVHVVMMCFVDVLRQDVPQHDDAILGLVPDWLGDLRVADGLWLSQCL